MGRSPLGLTLFGGDLGEEPCVLVAAVPFGQVGDVVGDVFGNLHAPITFRVVTITYVGLETVVPKPPQVNALSAAPRVRMA